MMARWVRERQKGERENVHIVLSNFLHQLHNKLRQFILALPLNFYYFCLFSELTSLFVSPFLYKTIEKKVLKLYVYFSAEKDNVFKRSYNLLSLNVYFYNFVCLRVPHSMFSFSSKSGRFFNVSLPYLSNRCSITQLLKNCFAVKKNHYNIVLVIFLPKTINYPTRTKMRHCQTLFYNGSP